MRTGTYIWNAIVMWQAQMETFWKMAFIVRMWQFTHHKLYFCDMDLACPTYSLELSSAFLPSLYPCSKDNKTFFDVLIVFYPQLV